MRLACWLQRPAATIFLSAIFAFRKVRNGEDAIANTRDACTTQTERMSPTAAFRLLVANWMKICRATSPNYLAAAERDQKCARRAVWPSYNRPRTSRDAHRDYRCNAAPSLRAF